MTVELGGEDFVVPALPASRWLEVLLAPQILPENWLPGFLAPSDQLRCNQMLLEGLVETDDFEQAIWDVLEAVSGRRWWTALRLCASVRAHWEWVSGDLALRGVRPFDVPLSFWLDGAYSAMIAGILDRTQDPRKVADWTRVLTLPPVTEVRKDFDEQQNTDAFFAALRTAR